MKLSKKNILVTGLAVMLAAATIIGGGTFAYLQGTTEDVVNTFQTNKVMVELTETGDGQYNIVPGTWETKDPTVTVDNTVDAYVYVKVTATTNAKALINYEIAEGWTLLDGYTGVYYREVAADAGEKEFVVLKDNKVSYDAALENSDMLSNGKLKTNVKLTFKAYAMQKAPFDDPVLAYKEKDTVFVTGDSNIDDAQFLSLLNNSPKIVVTDDLELMKSKTIKANRTLVLDGTIAYSGSSASVPALFYNYGSIGKPSTLTVEGAGGINATKDYCFIVGRSKTQTAHLVINGGTYTAPVSVVQCQYGTVTINGGFFACDPVTEEYGSIYLLNCKDDNYQNGTARIIVQGGTFVNFNPADNGAEGAGTNFVAEGYYVVEESQDSGDVWYTVVKETAVASPEELAANISTGGAVVLSSDIKINDPENAPKEYNLADNAVFDLSEKAITTEHMAAIFQGKNVVIKNGTFATSNGSDYPLFIGNGTRETSILVEDVTVDGGINVFVGEVVLRNVTADASSRKYYAVWADEGAVITIESGVYTGGTLNGKQMPAVNACDEGKVIIKGGEFNTDVSAYVADGFHVEPVEKNGGTWYTVVAN